MAYIPLQPNRTYSIPYTNPANLHESMPTARLIRVRPELSDDVYVFARQAEPGKIHLIEIPGKSVAHDASTSTVRNNRGVYLVREMTPACREYADISAKINPQVSPDAVRQVLSSPRMAAPSSSGMIGLFGAGAFA